MENAVDALKMAAAALIFIIAIGTSFSIFGTAKQTADSIIGMRDKQAYLESASLDNGILYTSSTAIQGNTIGLTEEQKKEKSNVIGVTKNGDRIVTIDDIISTLYRYSKEKYGVTIVKENGTVLARFDSTTESLMTMYSSIIPAKLIEYEEQLKINTTTFYATPNELKLKDLYKIDIAGNTTVAEDMKIKCGAPWYGNEEQIQKRIACELSGAKYTYNGQSFKRTKGLLDILKAPNVEQIVEVTNEIDNSKYLQEDIDGDGKGDNTSLLQQYELPTIEIVYIIMNK